MQINNTENHYGIIAITLHWVMAIIIIALLAFGIYMVRLPISLQKLKLFGWHKEWGILILMLAAIRLGWRWGNITPQLPASLPNWQKISARAVHWLFYGFMFILPLTGWMLSSAAGLSVSFFGWFVLPDLVAPDETLRLQLTDFHKWLGYALIAVIFLHLGAALKHFFINKDDILQRMLP